jgi:peptidoglycan hydrolase-like protein with peptidoglycan-binding domain
MKISILAATLGIATLAATPLFAQSGSQSPNAGKTPSATEGSSGGMSGGMSNQKGMSHQKNMGMSHSRSSRAGGINSQTVKQVQQKLSQQGLDVGPVDGKMGPKTRNAVKQFQDQKGIKGNGSLNRQTLAALGVESRSGRSGSSRGGSHMGASPSGSESGSSQGMGSSPSGGSSSGGMGGSTSH